MQEKAKRRLAQARCAAGEAGPLESAVVDDLLGVEVASIRNTEAGEAAVPVEEAVRSVERDAAREAELARQARRVRMQLLRAQRSGGGAEAVQAAARGVEVARELAESVRAAWPEGGAVGGRVARADKVLQLLKEHPSLLGVPEEQSQASRILAMVSALSGSLWASADGAQAGVLSRLRAAGLQYRLLDEPESADERTSAARRVRARSHAGIGIGAVDVVLSEGMSKVGTLLGQMRKRKAGDSLGVEEGYRHGGGEGRACWWNPPAGALNYRGRPAYRWEEPSEQLGKVPEHERAHMDLGLAFG